MSKQMKISDSRNVDESFNERNIFESPDVIGSQTLEEEYQMDLNVQSLRYKSGFHKVFSIKKLEVSTELWEG